MNYSEEEAQKLLDNVKKNSLKTDTLFEDINQENKELLRKKHESSLTIHDPQILFLLRERFKTNQTIFIPGNVSSSKNSKQVVQGFTGKSACCNAEYDKKTKICSKCEQTTSSGKRPMLINSTTVQNYIDETKKYYNKFMPLFRQWTENRKKPYHVGLYFIRDSERKFDYINACQIVCDLFQEHHWIDADDMENIKPVFLNYHKDKEKAGVIITLLSEDYYDNLIRFI